MNTLIPSRDTEPYYPSPESQGGWRFLKKKDDIHHFAQMDSNKIDRLFDRHSLFFGTHSSSIVIIRHGYLVREFYTFMTLPTSRFNVWSCTKSFTGTAWGLLLDHSR